MWCSFLLYVHKVQVIPDLTGNDPDFPKIKKKHFEKKRTESILHKIKIKIKKLRRPWTTGRFSEVTTALWLLPLMALAQNVQD